MDAFQLRLLLIRKVRCTTFMLSQGFWSSEGQGNCASMQPSYANFRQKEEEHIGGEFKMSLNQNDSGSTGNWQN